MISLKKKLEDKQKGIKRPRDQKKTNITIRDTLLVQGKPKNMPTSFNTSFIV